MKAPVVIAGGGLAAQRCVEALRREGFDGALHLVCGESDPPYDRPPLSKELLAGERPSESLRFRADDWYAEHDVEVRLGVQASALDPGSRTLGLADGSALRYSRLLIATGAVARRLPILEGFENVHTLRDLPDAVALGRRLRPGRRLVIVGAGFVGLEVASTARSLGVDVSIVEAAPAPLAGPLGTAIGRWFAGLHRRHGVALHLGSGIAGVHGESTADELVLEDGTRLATDAVLVAVGAQADTRWLASCGLPADGVPVGVGGATALPGVFAAGDCARPLDPRTGGLVRREHWESAARGGVEAARAMLGLPPRAEPPAGFWSDQHGIRIQLVGEPAGAERTTLDGNRDAADFSVTYWRGGRPAAVLLVGRPAELPAARRMVAGASPEPERSAA